MGTEREHRVQATHAPKPAPPRPAKVEAFVMGLREMAGNAAVQRRLRGQMSLSAGPDVLDAFRTAMAPFGAWREFAETPLRQEDLKGLLTITLPPGMQLPAADEPHGRSDEFMLRRDAFGLTIVHPGSESRVRVVAKDYRYGENRGGNIPTPAPGEIPAITYNLIAPGDGQAAEVLIAVGPGAWVELDEPVPYEDAREEDLRNEWEHGGRPARMGNFDLTVVEMPDNALVPLPDETIDVASLLGAGGKFHTPDRRTWRGAVTREDQIMAIAMIVAEIAMVVIPGGFELFEAAMLARAAAALEAVEAGEVAIGALEASEVTAGAITEDLGAAAGEGAALPKIVTEPGVPAPVGAASAAAAEPAAASTAALEGELNTAVDSIGGGRGSVVRICNDETFIEKPGGLWGRPGLSADRLGGAWHDIPNRTVWVHESLVRNGGVVRTWGARLNLRQVLAHEVGHAEAGSFECCLASRTGADLPGLTPAERAGLLEDAVRIAPREGVSLDTLNLPPDYEPPIK